MRFTHSASPRASRIVGIVSALALIGIAVTPGASAAPVRSSTMTLTFWSGLSGPDQTGMKAIVDKYNASQKKISINLRIAPFNNFGQELTTALAGGTGPNLWLWNGASDLSVETQGQQTPFDSYIKHSNVLKPSNFPKGLWNYYKYKGKEYQIPFYAVPLMMYYDKAILKRAGFKKPVLHPASSVLKAARKLTKGSSQYGMVIPTDWPMQFVWPSILAQFGGKPFNPKTQTSLVNSKAAVKALQYLQRLIYKYHTGPSKYAVDQNLKMLATGGAAQMFDGIWQYTNPTLQTLGKNLGISSVPQWGPHYKVFIGDLAFSLYHKNSKAQNKAAVKFIEYYEAHSTLMAKVGDVPVYLPVLNGKKFAKKFPAAGAAKAELSDGVYSVRYPNYDDHWLYDDALWPVLRGQSSFSKIKADLNAAAAAITNHVRHPSG